MVAFVSHRGSSAPWLDRAGVFASTLCLIHCLMTPVVLSFSATVAQLLPGEARIHRSLAVAVALFRGLAVVRGFRMHRRRHVVAMLLAGLGAICFGAWWGDSLPSHWMEVAVTMLGSLLLVAAHRLNHTFCKQCVCAGACST